MFTILRFTASSIIFPIWKLQAPCCEVDGRRVNLVVSHCFDLHLPQMGKLYEQRRTSRSHPSAPQTRRQSPITRHSYSPHPGRIVRHTSIITADRSVTNKKHTAVNRRGRRYNAASYLRKFTNTVPCLNVVHPTFPISNTPATKLIRFHDNSI